MLTQSCHEDISKYNILVLMVLAGMTLPIAVSWGRYRGMTIIAVILQYIFNKVQHSIVFYCQLLQKGPLILHAADARLKDGLVHDSWLINVSRVILVNGTGMEVAVLRAY